ncbi:MAG TPA: hypothetical protein VMH34_00055 [Gammaproteobacteria bacterium]|nr:hypothetical protein [Gammaproteobacteria bacterium]
MTKPFTNRIGLGLAALLLCTGISQGAWAAGHGHGGGGFHGHGGGFHHGGGSHFGFYIGAPWFWGWPYSYYPYPYYSPYYYSPYYYPPVSQMYDQEPPVYVQRNDTQAATPPANYWYYCSDPQGYYPYVQNCSVSWMQVVPQAPQ